MFYFIRLESKVFLEGVYSKT